MNLFGGDDKSASEGVSAEVGRQAMLTAGRASTIAGPGSQSTIVNRPYPTEEEARSARKYGHGYGTGNEAGRASIITDSVNGLYPKEVSEVTKDSPNYDVSQNDHVSSRLDRAMVAVGRNPIAKLGFDLSKINIDPTTTKRTIGGIYSPNTDQIYANFSSQDGNSLVHESIHRGLEHLRKNNPKAGEIMDRLPNEEFVVRHIMASQMGDPETGAGDAGDKQIAEARELFKNKKYIAAFGELTDLAADEVKNKRPRGPK